MLGTLIILDIVIITIYLWLLLIAYPPMLYNVFSFQIYNTIFPTFIKRIVFRISYYYTCRFYRIPLSSLACTYSYIDLWKVEINAHSTFETTGPPNYRAYIPILCCLSIVLQTSRKSYPLKPLLYTRIFLIYYMYGYQTINLDLIYIDRCLIYILFRARANFF